MDSVSPPTRRRLAPGLRLALVSLALLGADPAMMCGQPAEPPDVQLVEVLWGFDGRVIPRAFASLSVILSNSSGRPIDGRLTLESLGGLNGVIDVPIETDFTLPPFETRAVSITPYITGDCDEWRVSWAVAPPDGDGPLQPVGSDVLPAPRLGAPAAVLIANRNALGHRTGALKRFPAELFPASVTATDGLGVVVLNDVPDWQGARLQAFLEWLHRGGQVVLLQSDDRRDVHFPPHLGVLNSAADRFPVGSGETLRLPMTASQMTSDALESLILRPLGRDLGAEPTPRSADNLLQQNFWDRDEPLVSELRRCAAFSRRWWLIYLLSMAYLAVIVPGGWLVGRSSLHAGWFYLLYLGSAVVFSVAFLGLGRVGAGLNDRLRTATIATRLSPGMYDVSEWGCVAVRDPGRRTLTHDASGRSYFGCAELEPVRGMCRLGADAALELEMASGSLQPYVRRARQAGPVVDVAVQRIEIEEGRLRSAALTTNVDPDRIIAMFASSRDSFIELKRQGEGKFWESGRGVSRKTLDVLADVERTLIDPRTMRLPQAREPVAADERLEKVWAGMFLRLAGNAYGFRNRRDPFQAQTPPGVIRIGLLVHSQGEFGPQRSDLSDHRGCVLYVLDVPASSP